MSKEQVTISELLLSLDSSELQEVEQVRAAVNQQLSSDRGGAVLSSLVEYYLDSSSSQAVQLLSNVREPHHKLLLEKLHESVNRPGTRLAALTLLGHLIRKQPPWVHHISRSPLLPSLLRYLKTDSDVAVLITAVLLLITLLPMIPQAGKQHIYDFFDVFGRLASWSYRNPGHVPVVHLVHLHAGVYSLFHRLYGMFPCNFISYLRLHYSMKENLDTFQEVVKPMLDHVRVHPELVTGTQDSELDPSRWKCYEVHDIVIECSRVSLDPLESSCEEDNLSSLRDPPSSPSARPGPLSPHVPLLDLTCMDGVSSTGRRVSPALPQLTFDTCTQVDDVTWSPSSHCGLSTPPSEPAATGSTHPPVRTTPTSECPSPSSGPVTSLSDHNQHRGLTHHQVRGGPRLGPLQQPLPVPERPSSQPIREEEPRQSDVISSSEDSAPPEHMLLTSTPSCDSSLPRPPSPISLCFTPTTKLEEECPAPIDQSPAFPYEPLFELALPRAATLFIRRKTQEALEGAAGHQAPPGGGGGDLTSFSPLEALDQLIVHGHDAHECLNRRSPCVGHSGDRSHFGGEELQTLRSQLLLIHSQLQYERFKRQQHAIRNRRLLRRVINATALEEQSIAMRAQLAVQDEEIRSLKMSLEEEQRRYTHLQQDTHTHTSQLNTQIQQLLLQQQDKQTHNQRLQSDLQECQGRLRVLEAELQRANNKAYNCEHQLTQLSLKLGSSEQLQQQIFMMNQQLLLLKETNRALTNQLEGGEAECCTEASMLQCSVGKECQRLRDSEVQQRQQLDAANHRIVELENQLTKRDQLIQDQKKLLEDTKAQSRAELLACDSHCVALQQVSQNLQAEMLQLYSQIHLESHRCAQDVCGRQNGGSGALPVAQSSLRPRPSSSSVGILNGVVSTSPLYLLSCSSSPVSLSPIESPLAAGSFLEQRARQLFGPTNQSPEEEREEAEDQEVQSETLLLEATLPSENPRTEPPSLVTAHSFSAFKPASPPPGPAPAADLTLAVRQRRRELSIMDYDDETLPEY